MPTIYTKNSVIKLNDNDYLGEGSEALIYKKDFLCYKIYRDISKVIPVKKFDELSVLNKDNIIKPLDMIFNDKNDRVGFSMNFVESKTAICALFSNGFRKQNNIDEKQIVKIIDKFVETIEFIHEKDCLVVDMNEFNFMIDNNFEIPIFIDVDSYKTTSFNASAYSPTMTDGTKNYFDVLTDWYSFAILSCWLFLGVHPFKAGKHPNVDNIFDRMRSNISIFNKNISNLPKNIRGFDVIPSEYVNWYIDIFENGKRTPPPAISSSINVIKVKSYVFSLTDFDITELKTFDSDIIYHRSLFSKEIIRTKEFIYLDDKKYPLRNIKTEVLFIEPNLDPIFITTDAKQDLFIMDSNSGSITKTDIKADDFKVYKNSLYVKYQNKFMEVEILKLKSGYKCFTSNVLTISVMPNSTKLFENMLIQNILGKMFFGIPISNKGKNSLYYDIHIKELDGCEVLDVKYDNKVAVVIVRKDNKLNRFTLIFSDSHMFYEIYEDIDITNIDLNFTVLNNNVCVLMIDDNKMRIFFNDYKNKTIREVNSPNINNIHLSKNYKGLTFFKDNKLFSISIKKS